MDAPKINHQENGDFAIGNKANPDGKNQYNRPGYQPYSVRARYLLEKYTVDEIKEIVTSNAFGKLSVMDGHIIRHLANGLVGDEIGIERERLYDRIDGKASQPLKFSGDAENPINTVVTLKF